MFKLILEFLFFMCYIVWRFCLLYMFVENYGSLYNYYYLVGVFYISKNNNKFNIIRLKYFLYKMLGFNLMLCFFYL